MRTRLRDLTLEIYRVASGIAAQRGILLADTKLEFGTAAGSDDLVLGDEVLTPDSSRFWPADTWEPGHAQYSFDKQYVRNWLLSARRPAGIVAGRPHRRRCPTTSPRRRGSATSRPTSGLTGRRFADWLGG